MPIPVKSVKKTVSLKRVKEKNLFDKSPRKAPPRKRAKKEIDTKGYMRMVAQKAYELFEQRGQQHGYDQEDWYQAERFVQQEFIIENKGIGE